MAETERTFRKTKPHGEGTAPPAVSQGYGRTDLACERVSASSGTVTTRVIVGTKPVSVTRSRDEDGCRYVTVMCGRITERPESELAGLARLIAGELRDLAEAMLGCHLSPSVRILAAGFGNADMTPDAIGPGTVSRLSATRHLQSCDPELFRSLGCCSLAAFSPGVTGQTGMESAEVLRSLAALCRPDLIVAVDALAARSCERLGSTVQLSDRGLSPGSGVGHHRMAVTGETVGCPVMALGVPTVVDSATLIGDALREAGMPPETLPDRLKEVLETGRSFIVSPRDSDRMVELTCRVLAEALNGAFGIRNFL